MARLMSNVALTIPGYLAFRDMAIRVMMESCRLVISGLTTPGQTGSQRAANDADNDADNGGHDSTPSIADGYHFGSRFSEDVSSGFGEIFNNIVLHAYGGGGGTIRCEASITDDRLEVVLTDSGKSFDIDAVPPLQEDLPMGGMGLFIARAVFDELDYQPGPPNRWRLVKYVQQSSDPAAETLGETPAQTGTARTD